MTLRCTIVCLFVCLFAWILSSTSHLELVDDPFSLWIVSLWLLKGFIARLGDHKEFTAPGTNFVATDNELFKNCLKQLNE